MEEPLEMKQEDFPSLEQSVKGENSDPQATHNIWRGRKKCETEKMKAKVTERTGKGMEGDESAKGENARRRDDKRECLENCLNQCGLCTQEGNRSEERRGKKRLATGKERHRKEEWKRKVRLRE